VVAYRLIGILWGEDLCYIVIKAEGEVVLLCVQQAIGDVSHWGRGRAADAGSGLCQR
jgi:hypothetical protein